ncbi:hypothetical protein [Terrabacter sp. Root181]|uniref:hypothetical protein n=1 Tax=Terrabacter sp. Root181 TaxID=1736484 RepID=UPI0012F7FEF0|nr:hypothetical protein [Terrabacter sp. Root181]
MKDKVPFKAVPPADVMVAESFGSQTCAEVADVVSATKKHSLPAAVPAWLSGVG